jgi:hypothetical protein
LVEKIFLFGKPAKGPVYSCAETWDQLRVKLPIVDWHKVVWFSLAPKHAFILWLALRDALVTKKKMCSWGFNGSSGCLFCYGCQERGGISSLLAILVGGYGGL